MQNKKKTLEICLTPELYLHRLTEGTNHSVVIVDILRATTTIVTALEQGVAKIIPVADIEQLVRMKKDGYLVASERDGLQSDFADFGNSPLQFMNPKVKNTTIAFSSTNGTRALTFVSTVEHVFFGAFSNCSALSRKLEQMQEDIVVICAGWKQGFSLEDTVFAGLLCEKLSPKFTLTGDSAYAALSIWKDAKSDLSAYASKTEHYERLHLLKMHESIPYCFQMDTCRAVPKLADGVIVLND
ncbi:MAG: 2-phosphosulfolactate phosphatase [Lentimicrobiaceae bacterium]|nr:2-phosphosulfolactate phosphatase [Lentimicrobiaceae bacterium]